MAAADRSNEAIMRIVMLFVSLAVLGGGGYLAWDKFHERQRLLKEIEARERVIDRLTRTTRVAQAMLTRRFEEDGRSMSEVLLVEEDQDGEPKNRTRVVVEGDVVYFDALVLKFDSALVQGGDALKGRSVLLFRRIFGEHQKPSDGVAIDETAVDGIPQVYRGDDPPSSVEVALWRDFWKYANDPKAAAAAGVRVAQGEAPYVKMEQGKLYELTLDHSGGLNIKPTRIPAIFLDQDG